MSELMSQSFHLCNLTSYLCNLYLLQHHLIAFLQPLQQLSLGPIRNANVDGKLLLAFLGFRIGHFHRCLLILVVNIDPSGICSTFLCSSRMISALAVIIAFSTPSGLLIETRTSNVVTLSFSTPIGEIFVTLPVRSCP